MAAEAEPNPTIQDNTAQVIAFHGAIRNFTPIPEPFITDPSPYVSKMFLWVSHGKNISAEHNYYPMHTDFKYLNYYTDPYEPVTTYKLFQMESDPCRYIHGTCPKVPIQIGNEMVVFVPPILFFNRVLEPFDAIRDSTGLYYFEINKFLHPKKRSDKKSRAASSVCKIIKKHKLLTHANFVDEFGEGNITYSKIFRIIKHWCFQMGLNPADIGVGIFSCHLPDILKRINAATKAEPKLVLNAPPQATFVDDITQLDGNVNVLCVPVPEERLDTGWNELIGANYQGCAMNVLAYYKILDEYYAADTAACLPATGQSIFTVVNYINQYLVQNGTVNSKYMIVRYPLETAINVIYSAGMQDRQAVIFKMYREPYRAVNGVNQHNHVGHTVSIVRYGTQFYYIDPQRKFINPTDYKHNITQLSAAQIANGISNNGYFTFADIIYSVSTPDEILASSVQIIRGIQECIQATTCEIVPRLPSIRFGGSITNSKSKSKSKSKTRSKSKSKTRSKGSSKSKTQKLISPKELQKLDKFERLMLEADRKAGIKTDLLLDLKLYPIPK